MFKKRQVLSVLQGEVDDALLPGRALGQVVAGGRRPRRGAADREGLAARGLA